MNVNNEIKKINALIEALTIIRDYIKDNPELEVTVDVSTKTNNYKITYIQHDCTLYDVVNAESEGQAVNYLCWIAEYDDVTIRSVEKCDDLPSYWCPAGWVKSES